MPQLTPQWFREHNHTHAGRDDEGEMEREGEENDKTVFLQGIWELYKHGNFSLEFACKLFCKVYKQISLNQDWEEKGSNKF